MVPPPVLTGGLLWAGSVLAIFEVFAWSVLFSLLLNRVLWATVLGAVTAALFGFYAAQGLVAIMLSTAQPDYYVESMPLRDGGAHAPGCRCRARSTLVRP